MARGRTLRAAPQTRPTADLIKGAIFSMLEALAYKRGFEPDDAGTCDPGSTPLSACIASHCCSEQAACDTGWAGCAADQACMADCVQNGASGHVAMCTPGCNLSNSFASQLAACIDANCSRDKL